jgi:uncharacterized membrane protein
VGWNPTLGVRTVPRMDWAVAVVQWMHVLLGVLWFGTVLSLDVIVIPAINRLPIVTQRDISSQIGARATPIFKVVVPAIILLGIVRGTVLGPIKDLDALLGSAYGWTWLASLVLTLGVYAWGFRVLEPALNRMAAAPVGPEGMPTPALVAATDRVKALVGVELVGFLLIFTCMILMRFGR